MKKRNIQDLDKLRVRLHRSLGRINDALSDGNNGHGESEGLRVQKDKVLALLRVVDRAKSGLEVAALRKSSPANKPGSSYRRPTPAGRPSWLKWSPRSIS